VEAGHVAVLKSVEKYPHTHELMRAIRTNAPQVIFLSLQQVDRAMEVVREVEANAPGIQFIAIARSTDPQILLDVMRAGIREFLALPFNLQVIQDSLGRVREMLEKRPVVLDATDLMFAFLPSKAGVGTTTIAVNTAIAMSRLPDTNVLLTDLDLNCGMVRFMLKLDNEYSIADAAEHSLAMDENLWPQLVSSLGRLDVLHAGRINPGFRLEGTHIRHLFDFARRSYKAICVDLSGNMEKYSLEIMLESKRIFLVCTPEIPSLHLAREKYLFLKSLELGDRVSVLLNRCSKRQVIGSDQIEGLLGLPVAMTLPNDYQGVHGALTAGKSVEPTSELGQHFTALAQAVLDKRAPARDAAKKKKSLTDLFSFGKSRVPAAAPE
jgi:pilus assembly protein CpaE